MGAKKILFPLEMRGGEKVHTLEELKEKFDVGKVLEYAGSGQLARWLRDRGAAEMAAEIEALDKTLEKYAKGVCEAILGEVSGETLSRIEEAKKAAAERMKIEEEKAAAEQIRIEEERKKEEERRQRPTLLINGDGIYVVENDRVRLCKKFSKDSNNHNFGIVQEGRQVYYLANSASEEEIESYLCGLTMRKSNYFFLRRLDLDTGTDEKICETEIIALCGVRNHRLIYAKNASEQKYIEIGELDLDTLEKKEHKIEVPEEYQPGYEMWIPWDGVCNIHIQGELLGIDGDGKHMYCLLKSRKNMVWIGDAYYGDINLETDKFSVLIYPEIHKSGFGGCLGLGHTSQGCGDGKDGFIVWEYEDHYTQKDERKARCVYFDMEKREMLRLGKLEEAFCAVGEPNQICCGDGKVYWMMVKRHSGNTWTFVDEIVLMEYHISTGRWAERVCLTEKDFGEDFDYETIRGDIPSLFVGERYLYVDNFYRHVSWRFPFGTWKAERLVKDGSEYKYVQC